MALTVCQPSSRRLHAGRVQQLLAGLGKTLGHSLAVSLPVAFLHPGATAVIAPNLSPRHMQHYLMLEQRQIAHPPHRRLMDVLATCAPHYSQHGLQMQRFFPS